MTALTSNKSIVLRLIQKATDNPGAEIKGVLGKKALQKSVYFFNLKHSRFSFRWADYGPLSGEVQQIAYDLMYGNKIEIRDMPTKKQNAHIKLMTYKATSSDFEEFSPELDKTLDEIVKFTAGKSPRELELLASVHFWAQKQQDLLDEYTAGYIHDQLALLKPEAGFTNEDVESAIQSLEDNGFLTPRDH